jgi:hypothetical protein
MVKNIFKNLIISISIFLIFTLSSCQRIIDSVIDVAILSVVGPIVIILFVLIIGIFNSNKKN